MAVMGCRGHFAHTLRHRNRVARYFWISHVGNAVGCPDRGISSAGDSRAGLDPLAGMRDAVARPDQSKVGFDLEHRWGRYGIDRTLFPQAAPSGWGANSAQDWRDIADGYLVGRVIVPITEELVFRGLFFCPFAIRKQAKSFLAVLVSACTFAALHWGPLYGFPIAGSFLDILSALAAGLAFGALRAWTGSILPGLGLHIIGNSIGF